MLPPTLVQVFPPTLKLRRTGRLGKLQRTSTRRKGYKKLIAHAPLRLLKIFFLVRSYWCSRKSSFFSNLFCAFRAGIKDVLANILNNPVHQCSLGFLKLGKRSTIEISFRLADQLPRIWPQVIFSFIPFSQK